MCVRASVHPPLLYCGLDIKACMKTHLRQPGRSRLPKTHHGASPSNLKQTLQAPTQAAPEQNKLRLHCLQTE